MILFPAIDLKDGQCVRLVQGEMDQATMFNTDPAAQARVFQAQGFEWLHMVDLNGAFDGEPVNGDAVSAVLDAIDMPVQLGGGIRTLETAAYWIERGVARIILGTAAVRDPDLVKQACREFPGRVAVGLDARDGRVAVEGWADTTELSALEVAKRFEDVGMSVIIFTDISRDGAMKGLNVAATKALAEALSIPVIASGGVSSLADLQALVAARCQNIIGVISGRALYDGRLHAAAALAYLKEAEDA